MKKKGISLVGVAFVALVVLVVLFLLRVSLHRSPTVTLPEADAAGSGGDVIADAPQEAIRRVEVMPETVQRVIERLARPENYSRTITIERYWSDGSGQTTAQVRVAYGWMRMDVSGNGETRHVITADGAGYDPAAASVRRSGAEGRSWVWYGDEDDVYSGAAALTADEEQSIPTYENILLLDPADIAVADYRTLDGQNCIYVETHPDASGYAERYWIAVSNGLLAAAERLQGETTVYRMWGLDVETGVVTGEAFQLPDGEVLFRPEDGKTEG